MFHVPIYKISWMKNKILNQHIRRKNQEIKLQINKHGIFFPASFSFGVLVSLIFVIYFVMSIFTYTNGKSKHFGVIPK